MGEKQIPDDLLIVTGNGFNASAMRINNQLLFKEIDAYIMNPKKSKEKRASLEKAVDSLSFTQMPNSATQLQNLLIDPDFIKSGWRRSVAKNLATRLLWEVVFLANSSTRPGENSAWFFAFKEKEAQNKAFNLHLKIQSYLMNAKKNKVIAEKLKLVLTSLNNGLIHKGRFELQTLVQDEGLLMLAALQEDSGLSLALDLSSIVLKSQLTKEINVRESVV